ILEVFRISVSGKNNGGSALSGGITVQVREAYTKDVEVSETHSASGSLTQQSVWWKGDQLASGQTAQYLHVEPTWGSWAGSLTKTLTVDVTPKKAGTFSVYVKMYLQSSTNSFILAPGGTSNPDHQGEGTIKVGTVTV